MASTGAASRIAGKPRFILCNDGGTLGAPDMESPIGVEGLVRETIAPLLDTMINTLYWQIGTDPYFGTPTHRLSDWYSHRTKVGTVWGSDRSVFKTACEWRIYENAHTLVEQGTDSAAVVVDQGRKAGLEVFLSLRINDGHDARLEGGLNDINMVPRRREHPEWLLNDQGIRQPATAGRVSMHGKFAYNFAVPEVRAYTLALITEAIENYDLDGFDLDFCRQPSLFKEGEAERGAPLLTELIRQVRAALDAKGAKVGRKLRLSMRLPPDLDAIRKMGLDVDSWVKQGLVDIIVVGEPGGWHYRLPLEPYLALARGTGCEVIAQNLCAFRDEPRRSGIVLFDERNHYTTEQYRAVAARHWQAGAQGQYIWNQHFLKFSANDRFDRQAWKEIGTSETLAGLDKHYMVGPVGRGGNLPIALSVAGDTAETTIDIADPIGGAGGGKAVLRLLIEQLTALDLLDLRLNGAKLDRASARQRLNYNDCWLDFDVTDTLRKGNNTITVKVEARNPHVAANLVLGSVEALVTYR